MLVCPISTAIKKTRIYLRHHLGAAGLDPPHGLDLRSSCLQGAARRNGYGPSGHSVLLRTLVLAVYRESRSIANARDRVEQTRFELLEIDCQGRHCDRTGDV